MVDTVTRAVGALQRIIPDGFFVGGCVRDWLLGRPIKDLDVAVAGRVEAVGRAVKAALGGDFFWLREKMEVGRVAVPGPSPLHVDVVPLAGSLEQDLRRRDFTLNAMAVRVADGLVPGAPIIDPTGGRRDLVEGRLRLAAPDALEQDPLRCLRAFRFRRTLGLAFAPDLGAALRAAAPGLARISGERIRDELFVLLESDQSAPVVADLLMHDLVEPWSPPLAASAAGETEAVGSRAPEVGGASLFPPSGLELARALEAWLAERAPLLPCAPDLEVTLAAQITPPRSRRALTRLAALAVRAGPAATVIAGTLRLSGHETRILTRAISGAAALMHAWPRPGRARLRFSQRWEPGAVEAALLALAAAHGDRQGAAGDHEGQFPASVLGRWQPDAPLEELLAELLERRLRPAPPLLAGSEVMAILGLAPGPAVGDLMQAIEEERADGALRTPDDARDWLRRRSEV